MVLQSLCSAVAAASARMDWCRWHRQVCRSRVLRVWTGGAVARAWAVVIRQSTGAGLRTGTRAVPIIWRASGMR